MKDFPSCFGESGVQIADSSSSSLSSSTNRPGAQNLVTCVYKYHSPGFSGFITVTWIKYLTGRGLSIGIENLTKECICKVDIKPWLFSKRKGFKNLVVNYCPIDIHWDLSSAKFGSGPEPLEGFYIAVALNQELCLFLGDLENEAYKKMDSSSSPLASGAVFIAKREHVLGKRLYSSKAQFCDKGQLHDIRIEFDSNESYGKSLVIYIDDETILQVIHLKWKFRGNETILVDGLSVELYWDVHSWLFGGGNGNGNAIFLFQTRAPSEKVRANWDGLEPSVSSWPALLKSENSSHLQQDHGFSLVLCACKNE